MLKEMAQKRQNKAGEKIRVMELEGEGIVLVLEHNQWKKEEGVMMKWGWWTRDEELLLPMFEANLEVFLQYRSNHVSFGFLSRISKL
jgi:hypothetical protein